ncbi:hypothetical protein SAMN05444358_10769 [Ruegeria halocynthiae]|uniref:Uncharacterized protein n=1 Tax=Ruegeria halocynthiae TaxID=985054 RepID=A0A1H3CNG9_9RHOB|nr:hypothetical protein SAMN05444358_10769 [Ruegeria halocynthiae]
MMPPFDIALLHHTAVRYARDTTQPRIEPMAGSLIWCWVLRMLARHIGRGQRA